MNVRFIKSRFGKRRPKDKAEGVSVLPVKSQSLLCFLLIVSLIFSFSTPVFATDDTAANNVSAFDEVKDAEDNEKVANPVFSINGGQVEGNTQLTISTETEGASIYYLLNNTYSSADEIIETGTLYDGPITLSPDKMNLSNRLSVRAVAVKEGLSASDVVQTSRFSFITYQLTTGTTENGTVQFTVDGGNVTSAAAGQTVIVHPAGDAGYEPETLTYTYTNDSGQEITEDITQTHRFEMKNSEVRIDLTCKTFDAVETINSEGDFHALAESVNRGANYSGKTVTLAQDIDLAEEWIVIGNAYTPFTGTFDGNNKTVSGLSINLNLTDRSYRQRGESRVVTNEDYLYEGMFGAITSAAVKDLTVKGSISVIAGNYDNKERTSTDDLYAIETSRLNAESVSSGGVAALATDSVISGCRSEVSITQDSFAGYSMGMGGIAGQLIGNSEIRNCSNHGQIQVTYCSGGNVGGIVGRVYNLTRDGKTTISQCGNYAKISVPGIIIFDGSTGTGADKYGDHLVAAGRVGGIAGAVEYSPLTLDQCVNKAAIYGAGAYMGGIVGYSTGYGVMITSISNCYNVADVTGTSEDYPTYGNDLFLSGIAGLLNTGTITNCYNLGSVTSTSTQTSKVLSPINERSGSKTNCYISGDSFTPETLGEAYKSDENYINNGNPLLVWESDTPSGEKRRINLTSNARNPEFHVYRGNDEINGENGVYELYPSMIYRITVSAQGYLPLEKNVLITDETTSVDFDQQKAARVIFNVRPASAVVTVNDVNNNGAVVEADQDGSYLLLDGIQYSYTVTADGYVGTRGDFIAKDTTIRVRLREQGGDTDQEKNDIYGDGNEGKPHEITKGGSYYIGSGATGIMTISTGEPVTLIGAGTSSAYENLFINCSSQVTSLTLQDVYISDSQNTANLINFAGVGNVLNFEGINILDYDAGFTTQNDALIHVGAGSSLTVGGDGVLYQYNRTQGAGFGGNTNEMNGDITFDMSGSAFIKGTRQGAVIGAGANARGSGTPGFIKFVSGEYNLISDSRGAVIGGSAGSGGGSEGTTVYVEKDTNINVNVDYSGSAVGGGGYAEGNDASGGTLYMDGGSLRVYTDTNAANNVTTGWQGKTLEAGLVNDAPITAQRLNGEGQNVYRMILDTAQLNGADRSFVIKDGDKIIYNGGLHRYGYVQEGIDKETGERIQITATPTNWYRLTDEKNLYLYLTGEDHTLDVNGQTVTAVWNEETETFDLTYPEPYDPGTTDTFGNVEITTGEHGTTTVSPEQAKAGDQVTITAKPDEGYAVDQITAADANGQAIDVTDNGDGTYTFTMPAGKVNVNVTFAPIISIDAGTNGTATVDNTAPKTGDKVTITVTPNEGYEVDAVTVTDKDGKAVDVTENEDGTYSFTKPEGNVSVKVTYKTADPDADCPSRKYSDLDISQWYHEAVDFVLNNKYFQGTSDTTFEPDGTMTRAMFVTVLSRLEGIDAAQYSGSDFTDVETGQWYTAAIQWASQNGIVLGVGEQQFDPNGEVTREQMAAIMYRYAQFKKIDTTKADASKFGTFSDKDSVSDWAVEAMTWATGVGIINGTDAGIEPQANSTRAQVAQIVKNYTEKVS